MSLEIESIFRPNATKSTSETTESLCGPQITAITTLSFFLAKSKYEEQDGVKTAASITFSIVPNNTTDVSIEPTLPTAPSVSTPPLSELVQVHQWGTHISSSPESSESPVFDARGFQTLSIETVCRYCFTSAYTKCCSGVAIASK